MWYEYMVGGYRVSVKAYDEGSIYGINGGRVSKLFVVDKRTEAVVASYDRGWDVMPVDQETSAVVDLVVNAFSVAAGYAVEISSPEK